MKVKHLFIILSFSVLFSSLSACNGDTASSYSQYTLVYFDFSLSHDSVTLNRMVDQLVEVYKGQPDTVDCQFVVKVIENRSGRPSLFENTISSLPIEPNRKDRVARKEQLIAGAALLRDTIYYHYQTIKNDENCKMESCICRSLEHAYTALKDKQQDKVQLLVLSDMLEDCTENRSRGKRKIDFCDVHNYQRSFQKIIKDINETYEPEHLLSNYVRPENLYFIHGGVGFANDNHCLEEEDVEKVWQTFLKKMGYKDADFDPITGISYTSDVPERLKIAH